MSKDASYISILSLNNYCADSSGPWEELRHSSPNIPRFLTYNRSDESSYQLVQGINIDAPIRGAIVVLSATDGMMDLHRLAIYLAYRRGCRHFLVVLARSDLLSDDSLCDYIANEEAEKLRTWLGDVEVQSDWGSARKTNTDAETFLTERMLDKCKEWHSTKVETSVYGPLKHLASSSEALISLTNLLESLIQPVSGLVGEILQKNGVSEVRCQFHQEPLSEFVELDLSVTGHGLPFNKRWVLRFCSQFWSRGITETFWADDTCFQIDRDPRQASRMSIESIIPGLMLPCFEFLESIGRQKDRDRLEECFAKWRTSTVPSNWEMYDYTCDLLGMYCSPGLGQLGGLLFSGISNRAVGCRECSAWMPLLFNGGYWGDFSMFVWQCLECPEQTYVEFQT